MERMFTESIVSRYLAHLFVTQDDGKTNINSWCYILFKSALMPQLFVDSRTKKLEDYRHS